MRYPPLMPFGPSRRRALHARTAGILVAGLLLAEGGRARGQDIPVTGPGTAAVSEPGLSEREAQVLGAAAGLALGAALAGRPEGAVPALTPLDATDAVIAGSAVALYGAGFLVSKPAEAAPTASLGDVNAFDRKMRSLGVGRRSLVKRRLLDHISSATLMAAVFQPVGMLTVADVPNKWSRDVPVLLEATALTLSVNAFVKHLARRSRPQDHFCEEEKIVVPCRPDTRLSFYSGHASAAFVAAVAGGTLADFHHLEHRQWIWATGLTLATATGALRVMADQHYATDVLTGMAAGSLAGWLIPKLHKPDPTEPSARVAAPPAATALPVVVAAGRSTAVVTVGAMGGGPYVGLHWSW
jgi:membrane-associated phospholipid phosphatase